MRAEENVELQKSYLSYTVLRLPVMLEWQRRAGGNDLFAAAGASVELRLKDRSRYKVDGNTRTETNNTNMNPLGVNLEIRAGYGFLMVYGRAALTPLLKKSHAPECYPVALGLGIRI